MMRRNENKLFVSKIVFALIKFIFQVLCLLILIYQLFDITNTFLDFPQEVRCNVIDYDGLNLPSITLCLRKDKSWHKINYKCMKKFISF